MKTKINKISFKGQNIYVGIDVHLKSWKVTIMLENSIHKTFSMNPCSKELSYYLSNNFPDGNYYSAYEAGFCGYSVHRELKRLGIENIIVNPADIPTTDKERKQKEDKRDSRKIAKSLRNGDLQGIYIPDVSIMELRGLVRHRKTIVKEICRNKSRIKSMLHYHGIKIPIELDSASKYWSGRFTEWLLTIDFCTSCGKKVLNQTLEFVNFLRATLLDINRELRAIGKTGTYLQMISILCSVPGVGLITAFTLLSEIGNFKRFKSLDHFCSFVGLVPTTNSSGEKDITGKITPRSNKPIRAVIIESAWVAVRIDPALTIKYNKLCARMKANDAIVRIAKKLLGRIRSIMINEVHYEYSVA